MGINISIKVGRDEETSMVTLSGSTEHIITDLERETYKIEDGQLKNAVKAYHKQKPDDVFLHSPTPWNDLYKTYDWPQVKVILVPHSAEILGITSEPIIVKESRFKNDTANLLANFNASISDTVSTTSTSSWSTGGELSAGVNIKTEINFLGGTAGVETSFSYSRSWGESSTVSKETTVGSTDGVRIDVPPGDGVRVELSASRGVMRLRIKYLAYLDGYTAVNYNNKHDNHHFWGLQIGDVMESANIPHSLVSFEDIEIGYYSNAMITIADLETNALMLTRMLNDIPATAA